jgi:hypothetical protein
MTSSQLAVHTTGGRQGWSLRRTNGWWQWRAWVGDRSEAGRSHWRAKAIAEAGASYRRLRAQRAAV